ncbi:MAG: DUF1513 domain-containing protein [Pseudomonadota bacterium]
MLDRRSFLRSAGAAFTAALAPQSAAALEASDALFAAAVLRDDRTFGAAIFSEDGRLIHQIDLPGRGHDVAVHGQSGRCVVFARRPGTFAVAFHMDRHTNPIVLASAEGRHFYGHGAFSADGRLLYASENDFDYAQGKIGIYDVLAGYRRIAEFDSHGVGPHEIALMPDDRTLLVANGGIETHPDYRRQKLNLATMQPSIVLLDLATGGLKGSFALPQAMHRISLRHVAISTDGRVFIGGQSQASDKGRHPVLWQLSNHGELSPLINDQSMNARIGGYVGSLKLSPDQKTLAFSSPPTGHLITLSLATRNVVENRQIDTQGALRWAGTVSSPSLGTSLQVDNHCSRFESADRTGFRGHRA